MPECPSCPSSKLSAIAITYSLEIEVSWQSDANRIDRNRLRRHATNTNYSREALIAEVGKRRDFQRSDPFEPLLEEDLQEVEGATIGAD